MPDVMQYLHARRPMTEGGLGSRATLYRLIVNTGDVMGTLKVLIFDVDGTLADTEYHHLAAFNAAFAEMGLDWYWSVSEYVQLLKITGSAERMRHYIDRHHAHFRRRDDFEEFVARLQALKNHHYREHVYRGEIQPRPGVVRLLREARAEGLRLAIASTAAPENIAVLLEGAIGPSTIDWFDLVAAGQVVPKKKPAPDIYQWLLARLALAPEECIAFEDSANGLRAATAVGIQTVVTVNEFTEGENFQGAAVVLDSLGEPESPFRVIAGDVGDAKMVDIAFLRWLHAGE